MHHRSDETLTSILQILCTLASMTGDETVLEIALFCCASDSSSLLSDLVYNIEERLWFSVPYGFWVFLFERTQHIRISLTLGIHIGIDGVGKDFLTCKTSFTFDAFAVKYDFCSPVTSAGKILE